MPSERAKKLTEKLLRGDEKSRSFFQSLSPDQWEEPISDDPNAWSVKVLLAHFISAEAQLLEIAQDIASGGEGAPEDTDIDSFNTDEMHRMEALTIDQLLPLMDETREKTIGWLKSLTDEKLDRRGRHPTLGIVNVEMVLFSIYAHQLLHMREAMPKIRPITSGG
jgi:hypothetical protein